MEGIDALNQTLASGTARLAEKAMDEVIPVTRETLVRGDRAEGSPDLTVREQVRNHRVTGSDFVGLRQSGATLDRGWHGLGEPIEDGLSGTDAVNKHLPWEVRQTPCFVEINGKRVQMPALANYRSDNGKVLGMVGPSWTPVQNIDLGMFADALVGADASIIVETIGSLLGGRKVFLLCRVPREVRVGKTGSDLTIPYLLLANGHDGTMAMQVLWTMERVCCHNSYTRALGAAAGDVFRLVHRPNIGEYLEDARRCLGVAARGVTQYEEQARLLASRSVQESVIDAYFRRAYEAMYSIEVPAEPKNEMEEVIVMRRDRIVGEWKAKLAEPNQTIDGIEGTLWAAVNAITEWMDGSGTRLKRSDHRDHLKVLGAGAVRKRRAFTEAVDASRLLVSA